MQEAKRTQTGPKRHHYVSQFLLRKFSMNPQDNSPSIHQLNIKSNTFSRPSITNCAVIKYYNRLSEASGLPSGHVESLLADIEGQSAPLIEKLLHGGMLNEPERITLSTFLVAQQARTPRGREWLRFGQEQGATLWYLKQIYEDRERSKEYLRNDLEREPTEIEVDTFIRQFAELLESGDLAFKASYDQEILGMFLPMQELIPLIYDMNWALLKAPEGQNFILSDEPLVLIDVLNPGGIAAWRSSPTVEATIPLDPQSCLRLRQPPLSQSSHVITEGEVIDINLRTYAWAREAIFGPTKELLESVSSTAGAYPTRIELYRPKPPTIYIFEREDGNDQPSKVKRIPGPSEIKIRRPR